MTHMELQKLTMGRFTKLAETKNSIVVGTMANLNEENTTYEIVQHIAKFYNINTDPGIFQYHLITAVGARKRGARLPIDNYNQFIEFFI